MLALKEFANFITRNMANLATTYARLLAEEGGGYEDFSADRRKASGRKLLQAVVEACETETSGPLCQLFDPQHGPNSRWAKDIDPPNSLIEAECLGQTLTPVVTNLDAGKFLWQILSEVRTTVFQNMEVGPFPTPTSSSSVETIEVSPHPQAASRPAETLRESEARLSEALQIARLANWELDIESQMFTFNDQFYSLFHTTAEQEGGYQMMAADYARKFVHPDDASLVGAEVQMAIETTDPNYRRELEHRIIRADGTEGFISVKFRIEKDAQGRTVKVFGANQDITERKQVEEQLRKLSFAVEQSANTIVITDIKGQIEYVNPKFTETTGYTLEEAIGQHTRILKSGETSSEEYKQLWETIIAGNEWRGEFHNRRKNGELYWEYASITPIRNEAGDITHFLAVKEEITERKQAEAALAKRATELETVVEVSMAASTILETDKLLQEVVDLTKERFDLYHTHIYLLNEIENTLDLAAGAGEVGRQMAIKGWSIPFEQEQSLVARAARTQQGVTINDVHQDPHFLPNPLLPATRSEMAVPMMAGGQVLGVLDVQSDVLNRFTDEDVRIHTTLASQIAVALHNARLFAEQQQTSLLLRERVKSLNCLNDIGRRIEETPSVPELLHWITQRIPQAMQHPELCKVAIEFGDQTYGPGEAVNLPTQMTHGLYIGGELVGRVYIAYTKAYDFLNEESALLGGTATRLSVYIENRRLFEQTQVALAEVKQSQQLLRSIIDATPDWIFIKDQEHRYHLVNRGYAEALHLSPDDFVGKNDLELGFPEELVKGNPEKGIRGFWADDRQVLDSGEPLVNPYDPATIDGEMHIFHTIKTPLGDAQENVWGVLAFARDVTERERLLAETEALYQASAKLNVAQSYDDILTVLCQHSIMGLDAQHISLNYFDRPWTDEQTPEWIYALARISELPADLYSSRYPVSAFPSASQLLRPDAPTISEDMPGDSRLDENTRALYVEKFGAKSSIFAPLVVGGQWVGYVNAFYQQPMTFPEAEVRRLMALTGQAAVVVQSLRQLEEIQASEDRFRDVALSSGDWVWEVDAQGRYTYCSEQVRDVLGHTPAEVLGKTPFDFMPPAEQARVGVIFGDIVANKRRIEGLENRNLTKDGREVVLLTSGVPILAENGELLGYRGVDTDITDRKGTEAERERLLSEVERRARREQIIREITEKMRSATNLEQLVKMTAEELGQRFSADYALVELGIDAAVENSGQQTNGHE